MIRHFKAQDDDQKRETLGFLEGLCRQDRRNIDEVAHFVRVFQAVAMGLEDKGEIAVLQKCKLFL